MAWTTLCTVDDLWKGLGKSAEVDGYRLAIFYDTDNDQVSVTEESCPHAGAPMSDGVVNAGCAVCPMHGWAFDLRTGALRGSGSELEVLKVYPSRILEENGRRFVQADLPMP
jgi:nitrite reductase/ring-hydroxylating ferredoxin subunit